MAKIESAQKNILVRELLQEDIPHCLEIERQVYQSERWDAHEFQRHFDKATIKKAAEAENGKVAGYMLCAQGDESLELENIAVVKGTKGLGSKLIETILDHPLITLRVRLDNKKAIRFYRKFDFEYLDNSSTGTAIWMLRDKNYLSVQDLSDSNYEYVLQLIVQHKDSMWAWGSAFLISDRLALTAKHLYVNIFKEIMRSAVQIGGTAPIQMDAHQHFGMGNNYRRWSVRKVIWTYPESVDLLLLELQPHPRCPFASGYRLPIHRYPQLRMFPPAIGQQIMALGYPEDENKGALRQLKKAKFPDKTHELRNAWMWRSLGTVGHIQPGTELDAGSDRAPTFLTDLRSKSGMSGGPVFKKVDGGWQICGVISSNIAGGIMRASTLSPLLEAYIPVESVLHCFESPVLAQRLFSVAEVMEGAAGEPQINCTIKRLAEIGHINIPDLPIYALGEDLLNELRGKGTLLGSPDWTVNRSLDLSHELKRLFVYQTAHTLYLQDVTWSLEKRRQNLKIQLIARLRSLFNK